MGISDSGQSPLGDESAHRERIEFIEQRLAALVAKGADPHMAARSSLTERMAELGVPGVSVAVIEDGQIAWARGYGVVEAGQSERVTPATLFQCASISKPVSAIIALRLVESGALSLDEDVNERLTSWKIPPITYWNEQGRVEAPPHITLRQLLSHTAGLTVHGFPGYPVGTPLPLLTEILNGGPRANTPPIRVDTLPGVQMRYSGGGYTVLTQLLQDVTGQAFPALARELALDPLGMNASGFEQPLSPQRARFAARAHRTQRQAIPGGWHIYPELAPDGLWAPPSDLARLALGLQAALRGESGAILSAATMHEMMTAQTLEQGVDAVGLGVFLSGEGETARFAHSGGNAGFSCQLLAYQRRGQGAVVMTNSDDGWFVILEICNTIAEAYGWPDYQPYQLSGAWEIPDDAMAAAIVGTYADSAGRRCVVDASGDALWLKIGEQPPLPLEHDVATSFTVEGVAASVRFTVGASGAVSALTLRQNGRDITLSRQADMPAERPR
jgi:CubicO group peptidase (beta-lactamase class C family)